LNAQPASLAPRPGVMRRTYDWIISFAESPHAMLALFVLAFFESSFFPIPPDVLLLAMCFAKPRRGLLYAAVCAVGSVLGGIAGYYIGYALEPTGRWIITTLASAETFAQVADYYREDAFTYILIAAFTPIPYKVFTIAAGVFHESVALETLVMASVIGRSGRFFLVAGLIYLFGPTMKIWIERYLDKIMWGGLILLVGGFAAIKFVHSGKPLDVATALTALRSSNFTERKLMLDRVEKEAGQDFGFDPDKPYDDPANAAAFAALEAWLTAR
jgi:membrane protein YqaA with SNARE-associated domain